MIVTCPQCSTKFELPDDMLQPSGRKVKCTQCAHVWHQAPDNVDEDGADQVIEQLDAEIDELLEQAEESIAQETQEQTAQAEESNEGESTEIEVELKPDPESNNDNADLPNALKFSAQSNQSATKTPYNFIAFGVSALVVFGVAFLILTAFKAPISKAMPGFYGLFATFGIEVPIQGENMVFNNLQADMDSDTHMVSLTGEIVNLSAHAAPVYTISAQQLAEDGSIVKNWLIKPPVSQLEGGDRVAFQSEYPYVEGAHQIKLGFSLSDKVSAVEMTEHEGSPDLDKDHHGNENDHSAHEAKDPHASQDHHQPTQEHAPAQSDHQMSHGH